MTTMLGIPYVINSKAPVLDESALLAVNDLGPSGETWSLNSIRYDNGRIYHCSLKELVCIAEKKTDKTAPRAHLDEKYGCGINHKPDRPSRA
jgi:hypothetical protein